MTTTTTIYRVYFSCPCDNSTEATDHCDFASLEEATKALTHMSGAMRLESITLEAEPEEVEAWA